MSDGAGRCANTNGTVTHGVIITSSIKILNQITEAPSHPSLLSGNMSSCVNQTAQREQTEPHQWKFTGVYFYVYRNILITYVNFKSGYLTYNYMYTIALNKAKIAFYTYIKWINLRKNVWSKDAEGLEHLMEVLGFRMHYFHRIKHIAELNEVHLVKQATASGDPRKEVMLTMAAACACVHVCVSSWECISRVHMCLNPSKVSKQALGLSKCWASLTGCQRP